MMQSTAPEKAEIPASPAKKWLFLVVMVSSLLAGYLPPTGAEHWLDALNQNMVPAFAFILGVRLWWSEEARATERSDCIVILLLSLLFLIPSTQISWLVLSLVALWLFRRTKPRGRIRDGLLVIALAALQPLMMTYLLKLFAGPVLTIDAAVVAALLKFITGEGHHVGNIVYGPSNHQLLILRGCSSLTNLGNAWLVWFALARYREVSLHLREGLVVFLLSLVIVGLNLIRLCTMGSDLDWHTWWHSPDGVHIYQLISGVLMCFVILMGMRYVNNR